MRCLHGLIDDGQIKLVIYNEFIIQFGDFWKQPWARTISELLVSFGVALNHLWTFRYSKLEEIILQNSDQTRICTLDVEQNGKLFFHGYEIDPEMEYLYAAECHTENKFCCIMRPRDKLKTVKKQNMFKLIVWNSKYPIKGQKRDSQVLLNGVKLQMKLLLSTWRWWDYSLRISIMFTRNRFDNLNFRNV